MEMMKYALGSEQLRSAVIFDGHLQPRKLYLIFSFFFSFLFFSL